MEKGKALFMASAIDKDAEILYSVFEMVVDGLKKLQKHTLNMFPSKERSIHD